MFPQQPPARRKYHGDYTCSCPPSRDDKQNHRKTRRNFAARREILLPPPKFVFRPPREGGDNCQLLVNTNLQCSATTSHRNIIQSPHIQQSSTAAPESKQFRAVMDWLQRTVCCSQSMTAVDMISTSLSHPKRPRLPRASYVESREAIIAPEEDRYFTRRPAERLLRRRFSLPEPSQPLSGAGTRY